MTDAALIAKKLAQIDTCLSDLRRRLESFEPLLFDLLDALAAIKPKTVVRIGA